MRNRNLAVLVAALLFVRNLVLDLQCACACFDHFLGQQISCFCIAEACIDIGNDRHDMRLMLVNLAHNAVRVDRIACVTRCIELAEQPA